MTTPYKALRAMVAAVEDRAGGSSDANLALQLEEARAVLAQGEPAEDRLRLDLAAALEERDALKADVERLLAQVANLVEAAYAVDRSGWRWEERATLMTLARQAKHGPCTASPAAPAGWRFTRIDDRSIEINCPTFTTPLVVSLDVSDRHLRAFYSLAADLVDAPKATPALEPTADSARLDWLEENPRIGEIVVDGKATPCYVYAVTGAPGLELRQIIDAAIAAQAPEQKQ